MNNHIFDENFLDEIEEENTRLDKFAEQINTWLDEGLNIQKQHKNLRESGLIKMSYNTYLQLIKVEFKEKYITFHHKKILKNILPIIKTELVNGSSIDDIYNMLKEESKLQLSCRGIEMDFEYLKSFVTTFHAKMINSKTPINEKVLQNKKTNLKKTTTKVIAKESNIVIDKNSKAVPVRNIIDNETIDNTYVYDDVDDDVLEDKFDTRFKYVVFEDLSTKRIENILSKFYISPDKPDVVTEKRFFYIRPECYMENILEGLLSFNIFKDFDLFGVSRRINGRMENHILYFRLFKGDFIPLQKTQTTSDTTVGIMIKRGEKNYFKVLKKYADKIPEDSRKIYLPERYTS